VTGVDGSPDGGLNVISDSDEALLAALAKADFAVLRTVMFQLTRDERLREVVVEEGGLGSGSSVASDRLTPPLIEDPASQEVIIEIASSYLRGLRDGDVVKSAPPSMPEFRELAELFFGCPLSDKELPFWFEEFGVLPISRAVDFSGVDAGKLNDFHVIVIGAGMNGISAGIHMAAEGIPFTILERNSGVGGTWHENKYPGIRVDVGNRMYTFTFEADYPWRHYFPDGSEIVEYAQYCADKYGITERIQFGTKVEDARWDDKTRRWYVRVTSDGIERTIVANAIISAVGIFGQPKFPDIKGLDSFAGKVIHTARWDASYPLEGKRVAVIGTGSSGVQVVGPVAELASEMYVFQRAGTWIAKIPNYRSEIDPAERWLFEHVPYYVNWVRLAQVYGVGDQRLPVQLIDPNWDDPDSVNESNWHLRNELIEYIKAQLADRPDLIPLVIPKYPPLAKRLPKDNGWYEALLRDSVELVIDPIDRITPEGILTASGRQIDLDLIILATGFQANKFLWPIRFEGRNGQTLEDAWAADGARAYLGMMIPGFPNLFCHYGPNMNGPAATSLCQTEMQSRFIGSCFKYLIDNDLDALDVTQDAYARFNDLLDSRLREFVFMDPRADSYFRNEFGRPATQGPWFNREYWQWTQKPDLNDFNVL
jgi:4-hydroxyacetophenone monooxygenase